MEFRKYTQTGDYKYSYRIGILTNHYGHNYEYITELVNELKKDYPNIKDHQIDIVVYDKPAHENIMGIEASVKEFNKDYPYYRNDFIGKKF